MKYQITIVLECEDAPSDKGADRLSVAETIAWTASQGAMRAMDFDRNSKVVEAYTVYQERVEAVKRRITPDRREEMREVNMRGNVIIAGDEITAGINLDDATETGPIKKAFVMQFDSIEALNAAIKRGSVEFDFMRVD